MGWPSFTDGFAARVTAMGSFTSVMVVDTGVVSGTSFSKFPPSTPVMAFLTGALPLKMSLGAVVVTVPSVLPIGMVMVSPLVSLTITGAPLTGVGTEAV